MLRFSGPRLEWWWIRNGACSWTHRPARLRWASGAALLVLQDKLSEHVSDTRWSGRVGRTLGPPWPYRCAARRGWIATTKILGVGAACCSRSWQAEAVTEWETNGACAQPRGESPWADAVRPLLRRMGAGAASACWPSSTWLDASGGHDAELFHRANAPPSAMPSPKKKSLSQ